MCSESLGSEEVSYGPCAHQESCESLAAMAKFLIIRFDRTTLDIQIPPEVWCFRYVLGVQVPSQQVFGCLGLKMC